MAAKFLLVSVLQKIIFSLEVTHSYTQLDIKFVYYKTYIKHCYKMKKITMNIHYQIAVVIVACSTTTSSGFGITAITIYFLTVTFTVHVSFLVASHVQSYRY